MPAPDPQNLNVRWASELVRSLYASGSRQVVISPGSRSTPLTLAFAAHPGFRKHVNIDERSAAFTALGIAKASGIPACLVCTSGTAVANYYPAVIEATQSGVPMIVLSADRPPALRQTGASQTIDQIKIFGDTPVFFHEAGLPVDDLASFRRIGYLGQQAFSVAVRERGVSHINLPFAKPFEPKQEFLQVLKASNIEQLKSTGQAHEPTVPVDRLSEELRHQINTARKPLLIVGPSEVHAPSVSAVMSLSRSLNAPVLAEPASGFINTEQRISGFDGFLRSVDVTEALKPDLILRFGQEPVSRALSNYLEHHRDVPQIRFQSGAESGDSLHSATIFVDLTGELDIAGLNSSSVDPDWYSAWKKEVDSFRRTREQILNTEPAFTDGHVIAAVTQHLPTQIPFFCSNSFPIRDLSLFGDREEREVYANRGAAGIDGITSTAMGIMHGTGTACVLLTGDIAFLHDSNALLRHRDLEQPLVVILFNNGGGTIFRMLPVHDFKDQYLDYFETPQQVDINALCTAHGIPHKTICTRSELSNALLDLPENGGIHVYECQTDADASMSVRRLLWNN